MEPVTNPNNPPLVSDEKYIVFKRNTFYEMMGFLALPPWRNHETGELVGSDMDSAPLSAEIQREAEKRCVNDAVVIRRQDLFASSALGVYANAIGLVAKASDDQVLAKRLSKVADYFHQQSEAAAEQGWKYPD